MFLGRAQELGFLEELCGSGRPELFVLYGRRRVGKTELLQRFCEGRRAVCFQAAQVREKDNLRAFRDALRAGAEATSGAANRATRATQDTPAQISRQVFIKYDDHDERWHALWEERYEFLDDACAPRHTPHTRGGAQTPH